MQLVNKIYGGGHLVFSENNPRTKCLVEVWKYFNDYSLDDFEI